MQSRGFTWRGAVALLLAVVACALFAVLATGEADAAATEDASPNELIVVCEDVTNYSGTIVTSAEVAEVEDLGAIVGGDEEALLVTLEDGESVSDAIEEIERCDGVLYAQPNYTYHLFEEAPVYTIGSGAFETAATTFAVTTNDPKLSSQFYLEPWQASDGTCGANVREAWELSKTEGSVTVATIDSGCLVTHEDLAANIDTVHMKDTRAGTGAGIMSDSIGHGTHVAGIIGAVADNGKGIAGVSYNARVLPVNVFGSAGTCSTSDLLAAFNYLGDLVDSGELNDLRVINMSLGDYSKTANDKSLRDAIASMRNDHNVLTVCAGGNGDGTNPYTKPCYPSDFEESLSVTALTKTGENWHKSDYNLAKDISAPGASILSTYKTSKTSYSTLSGTSMATPVVSGIAALLWAYDPELSVDQVAEALMETAHPLDPNGTDYHSSTETGSVGAVDARAAIAYVDENYVHMTEATVAPMASETYDGGEHTPSITVSHDNAVLVEGDDYTVTYTSNVNAGTATATVRGEGHYVGRTRATFAITPASISGATVTGIGARTYTGAARTQSPTVTLALGSGSRASTATLVAGRDYTLSYKNNVSPGTATVTITGKGNFTGSISCTFTIKQVWYRVWGAVALDTMREVAGEFGSAKTAVVTTSTSFKDALAASALAGRYNAIVLMTDKAALSEQTRAALTASGVQTVYIVGSTANVPAKVEKQIKAVPGVKTVRHISATTPSQRAVAVAKATGKRSDTVIIATQNDYRDALSIAPYAYATKSPILFAEGNKKLSAATASYLKSAGYTKAIVVGGPLALPSSVDTQLRNAGIKQANITRLAGGNAYATSELIAKWANGQLACRSYGTYKGAALAYVRFQPSIVLGADKLAVSTGQNWKDAVCGAALCGKNKSVMLLADAKTSKSNYGRAVAFCTASKASIGKAYVLGGPSAVQAKVWKALLASTG